MQHFNAESDQDARSEWLMKKKERKIALKKKSGLITSTNTYIFECNPRRGKRRGR